MAHYALVYELLVGIPVLLAAALAVAHSRSFRVRTLFQRITATTDALHVEGKVKALIGFVQVIAVIGPVYSITMPNLYRVVLRALEVVYVDIFGNLFIPTECIGGFSWFLIIKSSFPVAVLAIAILWRCIWMLRSRSSKEESSSSFRSSLGRCIDSIFIGVLPFTLWIGIFFCVSVSASIFSAFHCRRFVDNSDESIYREFVIESLDIECPTKDYPASDEYYELRTLALILVGCWPATCLVGLAALLFAIRKRVLDRRPSKLSHAARVLTRDYKPAYFWWDFVELLRKLLLTGFVLAVPESVAFFRLVAALLFSVLFLVVQTMLAPFKDNDLQIFSLGLQSVVVVLFIGATYMYAYQQFGVAIANGGATVSWQEGRLSPLADVFVFESLDDLALICLVGMCVLGVALILLAVHVTIIESNAEVLKLKRTRAAPVVTIRPQHQYHLFLSHVWSTGQDQAAVIKRQLLRMVHGMNVFLDVDDLEDIGALERYIDESMVCLIFLSRGYFSSRNCLREVRACKERKKPILLVHETDDTKGGLTIEEAREECPEELREYVFGVIGGRERPVLAWHRITVFQLCTLKEIARQVLRHTPLYATKPMLGVYLDRDVSIEQLRMQRPVAIYTSPNNPGCDVAVKELATFFTESELCVVSEPLQGMLRLPEEPDEPGILDSIDLAVGATGPSRASSHPSEPSEFSGASESSTRPAGRRLMRQQKGPEDLSKRKQIFLLYLNRHTFVGPPGELLASEVAHALQHDVTIVMLHENDRKRQGCEFGHFFKTTPRELVDQGLYKPIALAMYPMPHREVSLTLVALTLGGVKRTARSAARPNEQSQKAHAAHLQQQPSWLERKASSLGRGLGVVPADPPPPPPKEPRTPPRQSRPSRPSQAHGQPRAPRGPLPSLSERKFSKQRASDRSSVRGGIPRASGTSSVVSWMADYDDWDWESAYDEDYPPTPRTPRDELEGGPSSSGYRAPRQPLSPIQSPGCGGPRETAYDYAHEHDEESSWSGPRTTV